MKILVFSDSHHCIGNMYDAVELEKPDMAFHLGDCIGDAQDLSNAFPMLDLCYVPGNCDHCTFAPASLVQEADGVRIFLTHGHLFGVKTGLTRLLLEGKRVGAQLVLFGHTHRPYLAEHDGVWLLNPGSCSAMQGSYAVLTVENGSFHAELKEIG